MQIAAQIFNLNPVTAAVDNEDVVTLITCTGKEDYTVVDTAAVILLKIDTAVTEIGD